jgi:hypothetical protein
MTLYIVIYNYIYMYYINVLYIYMYYIYVYSIWYIWIKEMFGHKRSIYIYINWINIYINLDIISIYQSLHPEILDQRFFAIAPRSHAESIGRCSAAARQDLCHGFLGMVNLHTANIGYPFRMVIFIDFWDYVFCHCFSHTRIYIYMIIYVKECVLIQQSNCGELWYINLQTHLKRSVSRSELNHEIGLRIVFFCRRFA